MISRPPTVTFHTHDNDDRSLDERRKVTSRHDFTVARRIVSLYISYHFPWLYLGASVICSVILLTVLDAQV